MQRQPGGNSGAPASTLTPRACEGGRCLIFQFRLCPQALTAPRASSGSSLGLILLSATTGELPLPLHLHSSRDFRVPDLDQVLLSGLDMSDTVRDHTVPVPSLLFRLRIGTTDQPEVKCFGPFATAVAPSDVSFLAAELASTS